jgi:hypothetical protein
VGGLCITRAANFVGYRTDKGNYEFLTFLAVKQMINNKKENLHFYLTRIAGNYSGPCSNRPSHDVHAADVIVAVVC